MTQVGPVCHIPPSTPTGNPQPQNLPGIPGPVSPPPPSGNPGQDGFNQAMAALLNAMRQMLMQLSNQVPQNNFLQNPGGFQRKPDPGNNSKSSHWIEVDRVTDKVKVFQNNDKTSPNWVEVDQINRLIMRDSVTGSQWEWRR